jgi:hypothetical protein
LVWYIVNIRAGRALTNSVYNKFAVYSRLGHLARSVDIGDEHSVRKGKSLTKLTV